MSNELNKNQEENKNQNNSNTQSEGSALEGFFAFLIILGIGYFAFFKAIPFIWNKTSLFIGHVSYSIGDIFDGDKRNCKSLIKDIDKISSLDDFNKKTNNKEIFSKCENKNIDISKVKELGEKLEKEKADKEKEERERKIAEEERIKKEKEEKELAEKREKEEAQKKIDDCKNSGGDWLEYDKKCKTKAEKDAEKEEYRKDCIKKSNYVWDGNNCNGREWYWQGNDRQLNSDSRVSSNESKIVNEVFNAVERKSKNVDILDSGDGRPWTITIKMKGDSVSEYTAVFYIVGNGRVYRAIVKNGSVIN